MRNLAATLLLPVLLLAGCATIGPPRQVNDVRELAGRWQGWSTFGDSVSVVIREDGRFEVTLTEPGNARSHYIPGRLRLDGGVLTLSSGGTDIGTLTLHEADGKRVLKGDGARARDGAPYTVEVTETKY